MVAVGVRLDMLLYDRANWAFSDLAILLLVSGQQHMRVLILQTALFEPSIHVRIFDG